MLELVESVEEEEEAETMALFREIPLASLEEVEELILNFHLKLDRGSQAINDFVTYAMQLENQTMLLSPTVCLGVAVFPPMAGPPLRPA